MEVILHILFFKRIFKEIIYFVGVMACCPWWRHQMETFSALLALCAGNSPVPVNSRHKGQWLGALIFSSICARINNWVNNREAGDLRRHRGHYDDSVIRRELSQCPNQCWLRSVSQYSATWPHRIKVLYICIYIYIYLLRLLYIVMYYMQ